MKNSLDVNNRGVVYAAISIVWICLVSPVIIYLDLDGDLFPRSMGEDFKRSMGLMMDKANHP